MIHATTTFRFAAALVLTAFAGTAIGANAQSVTSAANAADQAAQAAEEEIRAIDPTTGGDSLVIDPSLPTPYGVEVVGAEAEAVLPAPADPLADRQAARMISDPVVQSVPVAQPVVAPQAPVMVSNPVVQSLPPVPAPPVRPHSVASDDPFVIKSILPIEGTIRYGDWYWDESRAPKHGKLVITVDLHARVISVFRDGHEIGTAVALLGTRQHPTPIGTFPILTKEKDNVSEKYNNAPMPWTLRLTWDGIAIHGSPVINGYASHGCVGVPDPFAERLFAIAKRGDKVVITRGKIVGMGDKLL